VSRILGLDHQPIPPTEIVDRIKQIDSHLDLKWGEGVSASPGWWLIYRWPENDKRWEMTKRGDMHPDDAWDWFTQLPSDCPVEQAYGFIVKTFRNSGHKEAKRLLGRTGEYNAQRTKELWKPIQEEAMEMVEHNAHKLFADSYGTVPKVRMGKSTSRRRGKTAKEL
jgi:hypothetical protein